VLEVSLRGPCGSGGVRAAAVASGVAAACGRAGGRAAVAGRGVYAAGAVGADVGIWSGWTRARAG
jgi:hypothetical protein